MCLSDSHLPASHETPLTVRESQLDTETQTYTTHLEYGPQLGIKQCGPHEGKNVT